MRRVSSEDDETARSRHIEAMGQDLGSMYHSLASDLALLHTRWQIHRQLFGFSQARYDTLARSAPKLFYLLQRLLWEDILLGIARMTDSPRSAGRANLTLRSLPSLVQDPELQAAVDASLASAINASEFARQWRHRQLAHRDLDLALGGDARPLPIPEVPEAEAALVSLGEVLNLLAVGHAQPPIAYELVDFGDVVLSDGAARLAP